MQEVEIRGNAAYVLYIEEFEKRMSEQFEERFNRLKDSVVTLIAEKLSVLIEENNTLKSTLKDEIGDLREWQSDINTKVEEITTANQNVSNLAHQLKEIEAKRESEKKQITVIHNLVKSFNGNLAEIEQNSKQSIQEVQEDVQSVRENICEMLTEVPQVTMSSLETRFSNIEEMLSTTVETIESRNCLYNASSQPSLTFDDISTAEVANEIEDRRRREGNVVLHNVPENSDQVSDEDSVNSILMHVLGKEIEIKRDSITNKPRIYRLGKKIPGKNRSIKCHLKSKEMCEQILSQSRRLSESSTFSQVVLQGDLTPNQRSHIRQLVNEKKKRNSLACKNNQDPDWVIRSGKLCRKSDYTMI